MLVYQRVSQMEANKLSFPTGKNNRLTADYLVPSYGCHRGIMPVDHYH